MWYFLVLQPSKCNKTHFQPQIWSIWPIFPNDSESLPKFCYKKWKNSEILSRLGALVVICCIKSISYKREWWHVNIVNSVKVVDQIVVRIVVGIVVKIVVMIVVKMIVEIIVKIDVIASHSTPIVTFFCNISFVLPGTWFYQTLVLFASFRAFFCTAGALVVITVYHSLALPSIH